MHKIIILITLIILISGCSYFPQTESSKTFEKINARVIVYIPEDFRQYQSDHPSVLKTLTFKFEEPVARFLPLFFTDTFAEAYFPEEKGDLKNTHDFQAVPKFESAVFYSDKTFGHELMVVVSVTFTPVDRDTQIVVKGTGVAENIYGGRTIYEQDMADQAFVDALKDLQIKIQDKRSLFDRIGLM
jgi:hypothetical protein